MTKYLIFIFFVVLSPQIYSEKVMILDSIKKNILDNQRFLKVNQADIQKKFILNKYNFDIFSGGIDSSLGVSDYKVNFLYQYDSMQRSRMSSSNLQDGYFVVFIRISNNGICKIKDCINFFYKNIFDIELNEKKLKEIDSKLEGNKKSDNIFETEKGAIGVKFLNSDNNYDYYKIYFFN